MRESFASFWLSRAAIAAMVIYISSAFRIWKLSPHVLANRIAAALCVDLAVWALQAAISYAADSPELTVLLSRLMSWSWPFFPALGLHLALEITDSFRNRKLARSGVTIALIYGSAALVAYMISGPLLRGAVRRAGYWSVDLTPGLGYTAFSAYYFSLNAAAIVLVVLALKKTRMRRIRMMLGIVFVTHAVSLAGGFTTDTILSALGYDVPKVGVLWASVWAIGLNAAIERYGFLAPLSPRDTGLLMNRFIERSQDGIVVSGPDGKVVYWNDSIVDLTGIAAPEAIGEDIIKLQISLAWDGIPWPHGPAGVKGNGAPGGEAAEHVVKTFQIRRRDGAARWLQMSDFTIPSTDGDIWAAILRDVTSEKNAAAEALDKLSRQSHAQRMEALGALAGGIAHDFNNTLGGIVGAVSLIKASMDDASPPGCVDFSRELDVIHRSAQRAASSVRGLMAFALNRPQRNEPFRLEGPIRRVAEFAGRTFDHSVKVIIDELPPEATVRGDAPQVEQLALNLVINAAHAMTIMRPIGAARGGMITLAVRATERGSAMAAAHPEAKDIRYWALSVSDEGVGMDQKTKSRAFDPFFTTKATDQGSGLGLSMVDLIARQHGGFVDVESEPGVGSLFTVYLPACDDPAPA